MKALLLCEPSSVETVRRIAASAGIECLEVAPGNPACRPDLILAVGSPIPGSLEGIPALSVDSPEALETLLDSMGTGLSPLHGSGKEAHDNLPVGIFAQRDGLFYHVNAAFASIFGYTVPEMQGRLGPADIVHPDDLLMVSRSISARTSGLTGTSRFDFRGVGKDGSISYLEAFTAVAEIDGGTATIGVVADISARRVEELATISREKLSHDIIENLPLGITVRSSEGRILLYNRAWLRLWRLEEDEVERIERRSANLSLPERFPRLSDHMAEVEEIFGRGGDLFLPEQQVQTPMGRRWISQRLYSVPDGSGGVGSVVVITDDVTDRRNQAEEARRVQKTENMTVLLGGIAHELNNLLTPISGYAEMARKLLEDASPAKEPVIELSEAASRACRQVRQLMAMSRRTIQDPKPVDLRVLLNDFATLASRLLGESVLLKTHLPGTPVYVTGDESELMNVFVNLAMNSREAMPDGGMVTLRLWTDADRKTANVIFSDSGTGMDADTVERVLEPFFTTRAASGGAGLGLPSSQAIVRRHGGDLKLSSSLGIGTTLEIELPLGEPPVVVPRTGRSPVPAKRGGRILVAEDDEAVLSFMRMSLEHAGYEVYCARDGAEALGLLEAGLRPDCMIADVVMPHLDGRALLERFRITHAEIPVLFVSGYPSAPPGLATGDRVRFLEKPFTSSHLLRALDELMGLSLREAAAGRT